MNRSKIFSAMIVMMLLCVASLSAQERLTIPRAIEITLENNYDIQIAAEQTQSAQISNSWGFAGRYPTISLNATSLVGGGLFDDSPTGINTNASIQAQWLLFGGMRVNVNKAMLDLKYNLAKGTEELEVENSVKSVILAYYAVLLETQLHKLYDDVLALSKDRFDREKSAYDLGGSDTFALIEAQSAYLTDLKTSTQQQRVVRNMVYTLNNLMGVDPNSTWEFDQELTLPTSDYSIEEMREKMFADNKTMRNQYINQQIAHKGVEAQRSLQSPTLSLLAGVDYTNTTQFGGGVASDSFVPSVGATLNFNIFNGFQARKNVEIAEITSKTADLGTEQLKLYLDSQLLTNYDLYTYNKTLVEIGTEEVEITKKALDLSFEKFENGSISSFDFRQVQLSYLQSLYSQTTNVYALINANINLAQLIGGILSE